MAAKRTRRRVEDEGSLWKAREPAATGALGFWNTFLILRSGPTGKTPLDAAALGRWLAIIRAVSWVESRHGTATTNRGVRDPMQCGHPADAWWRELIVPGSTQQDRFITGPGGSNYYAGDLPAAVASVAGFPAGARLSALGDKTKGHDDLAFNERTSYYWGVPFLIHKTNTTAGQQTYQCGDLDRDRLIDGAVAYNGGGDPDYRAKIVGALELTGGLAPQAAPRAILEAARADPPLRAVVTALSDLVGHLARARSLAPLQQATASVAVDSIGGEARLADPGSPSASRVTLTLTPRSGATGDPAGSLDESAGLVALLESLLAIDGTDAVAVAADVEVGVEFQWSLDRLVLRPANVADAPCVLTLRIGTEN